MTACSIEPAAAGHDDPAPRPGCVLTADGAYAARLAVPRGDGGGGDSWFPERWTLDGPEPYAVPLPGNQPEEPGTEVQPMGDGRVLICRPADGRHFFSLLYPTGPGTGELPLGAVQCPPGARLRLLPPAPGGAHAYALAAGPESSTVWLVAGGAFGPEHVAHVPGRCAGGVWLDRAGRMLALDRTEPESGRTKAVVVDLGRGGEVSPLLQIAADSDDRLLLADPDSGLLLVRSDAPSPGAGRLGWGVLGSTLPVRFPECLRVAGCVVTPFAIQPGQVLTPESCGVALRIEGAGRAGGRGGGEGGSGGGPRGSGGGSGGSGGGPGGGGGGPGGSGGGSGDGAWVGVWRPADRRLRHLPAPEGWLTGAGLWTPEGVLRLPCATEALPCGVRGWAAEWEEPCGASGSAAEGEGVGERVGEGAEEGGKAPAVLRPVPLQQAPLARTGTQPPNGRKNSTV
ncbi:hypothetical protein AB0O01_03785 [Streptomyces sp. NPDC093252]|uniref:hypothetical protein n=1 Tax=Streptomyces sp. NPDC093252 TaxID=3154980 RepID=UPI003416C8DA